MQPTAARAIMRPPRLMPSGFQGLPWYEIRSDKVYRTVSHPDGFAGLPNFEIRDGKIFTTVSHPAGYHGLPWFEIR